MSAKLGSFFSLFPTGQFRLISEFFALTKSLVTNKIAKMDKNL